MLIAEIHGLYVPEAQNSEDYLTSTIFGHLRYIQPGPFWDALFEVAFSEPIAQERINASEYIRQKSGGTLGSFATLHAIFWPEHKAGVPDLILHFSGNHPQSVAILVEAKLNATKSGIGERDQLARYLRILDSLADLRPPLPADAITLAVYLTTIDSRNELVESLAEYGDTDESRQRLFQLRWQDLVGAIDRTRPNSPLERLVRDDVRAFLRARDLEYFSGMESAGTIPAGFEADGEFLKEESLFDMDWIPTGLDIVNERWMHAD